VKPIWICWQTIAVFTLPVTFEETRHLISLNIKVPNAGVIRVICTHLDHIDEGARLEQWAQVEKHIKAMDADLPTVILA
jgi:endonuclease/exonuclease/phosphatase family metal-dependent hydrolase